MSKGSVIRKDSVIKFEVNLPLHLFPKGTSLSKFPCGELMREQKENVVLILRKLKDWHHGHFYDKGVKYYRSKYELEDRWLNNPKDHSSVKSNGYSYLRQKNAQELFDKLGLFGQYCTEQQQYDPHTRRRL